MTQPSFDPDLAEIRFGTGLSPRLAPPASVADILERFRAPDLIGAMVPIPGSRDARPRQAHLRDLRRARTRASGVAREEAQRALDEAQRALRVAQDRHLVATVSRGVLAEGGLRERLTLFWADHFTVVARSSFTRHLVEPFVEDAIRPNLGGRFETMLIDVATHPMMLDYLDQSRSVGPGSRFGQRSGRGLNENLAREILELHTLGVSGPYAQADVRELAELLTGLITTPEGAAEYRPDWAEPGAETVLGRSYPDTAALSTVHEALRELARHPATAAHLARKLAVHFVADTPPPDLVDDLAAVWRTTGGDLGAVTEALVLHPDAWTSERLKVRRPIEFIMAALRALAVPGDELVGLDARKTGGHLRRPLALMGQSWNNPAGPDGFPEAASAWVTAQGLAGRIDWAMRTPAALLPDRLPDPRDFANAALGREVPAEVAFAASAAESRAEGIGLILASAAFQRR